MIEALPGAEREWGRECDRVAKASLFKVTASRIFGQNVPGKKYALRFYFGGLKAFYESVQRVVDDGFAGFRPLGLKGPRPDREGRAGQSEDSRVSAHL